MQQELESLGIRSEIAEGLEVIMRAQLNGSLSNDTVSNLRQFGGFLNSLATRLEKPQFPSAAWIAQFKERQKDARIAAQNTALYEMEQESEGLNPAQEESLDNLTVIPPIFDRRETEEETCDICGETESPYFADGICKTCYEATEDNADDIDGGQPAILTPPPDINPRGPAPAEAIEPSDMDLIMQA